MSHERAEESVTEWIAQLQANDQVVAQRIWERYMERLVRLARRKLRDSPRRVVDEEDIALEAFDAFLRGMRENRFARLDSRDDVWQILVMLTERKAIGQLRQSRAAKRGRGLIRGESAFESAGDVDGRPRGIGQILDAEPTPEFAMEFADLTVTLLRHLEDDSVRAVARGLLAGLSQEELARQLDCSVRSIQRKLARIRATWDHVFRTEIEEEPSP